MSHFSQQINTSHFFPSNWHNKFQSKWIKLEIFWFFFLLLQVGISVVLLYNCTWCNSDKTDVLSLNVNYKWKIYIGTYIYIYISVSTQKFFRKQKKNFKKPSGLTDEDVKGALIRNKKPDFGGESVSGSPFLAVAFSPFNSDSETRLSVSKF